MSFSSAPEVFEDILFVPVSAFYYPNSPYAFFRFIREIDTFLTMGLIRTVNVCVCVAVFRSLPDRFIS